MNLVDDEELAAAVAALRRGRAVGMPTETVYGVAADATNIDAVASIYRLKGRPASNPLIVHIADAADVEQWAAAVPAPAQRLMQAFWPGPLTLVLEHSGKAADAVVAGLSTIALRCPDHPLARALLREFGGGLAAPSANRSGAISPTSAEAVRAEFGPALPIVLDGGPCEVGIESTIIDATGDPLVLLRPGTITAEDIAAVASVPVTAAPAGERIHPGSSARHYAPETPVRLVGPDELPSVVAALLDAGERVVALGTTAPSLPPHDRLQILGLPRSLTRLARDLYARLRQADAAGATCIVCELPPATGIGAALRDRLGRAAATR